MSLFLQDFTKKWFAGYNLISPRLQELLYDLGATGFELRDVADMRLGFEHSPEDRQFRQLLVTGWGGLPAEASGTKRIDAEFGKYCYGGCTQPELLVDPDQWDGSDIFYLWPFGTLITERVARLLIDNKIKHCDVEPLEKLRITPLRDGVTAWVGTPLRLIYQEERAKQLGHSLGIDWWEEG